ncbi:MAG: hypothetical protein H0X66_12655 [Verrucomicrobia bacterium]|nr:hypothetical protein [Verrucomicrobiota bacterium]
MRSTEWRPRHAFCQFKSYGQVAVAVVCAILIAGCQSPRTSRDAAVRIASSLERRVTDAEARHILVDHIEHAIHAARAANHKDSSIEVEILSKKRHQLTARFDSFLSRSSSDDQLWAYRTYATPDQRGGESGFALVRGGRVVEYMGVMIYD